RDPRVEDRPGVNWYPAPAKLNLFLHVLGRRPDGYHLLQTVFRLIDRSDRIGIVVRDDGVIRRVNAHPDIEIESDLCLRAAHALQEVATDLLGAGVKPGADISLDKQVPIGGGLGGGSSDAATVLLVLNKAWKLNLDRA